MLFDENRINKFFERPENHFVIRLLVEKTKARCWQYF